MQKKGIVIMEATSNSYFASGDDEYDSMAQQSSSPNSENPEIRRDSSVYATNADMVNQILDLTRPVILGA